jgi:hypothetical protein
MRNELRTVFYDAELHIEAYRPEGTVLKFPGIFTPVMCWGLSNFFKKLIGLSPRQSMRIFSGREPAGRPAEGMEP